MAQMVKAVSREVALGELQLRLDIKKFDINKMNGLKEKIYTNFKLKSFIHLLLSINTWLKNIKVFKVTEGWSLHWDLCQTNKGSPVIPAFTRGRVHQSQQ